MPRKCPSCRTFTSRWIHRWEDNDACRWPCSEVGVFRRMVVHQPRFRSEAIWRVKQAKKRRIYGATP